MNISSQQNNFSTNSRTNTKTAVDYLPKYPLKEVDYDTDKNLRTRESYHYKLHFMNKTKKRRKK